jgi:hypothetical protein
VISAQLDMANGIIMPENLEQIIAKTKMLRHATAKRRQNQPEMEMENGDYQQRRRPPSQMSRPRTGLQTPRSLVKGKPTFQKQRVVTAQPGKHHRRSRHTRNKTSLMSSMVDITSKLHQVDDYQEKSELNDKPLKQLSKDDSSI